jgi:arabinosyltransferase C
MVVMAGENKQGYFMNVPAWTICFLVAAVAVALVSTKNSAKNLILSWAMIGVVAIYFPALFQRKLSEGLSIPWAILALEAIRDLLSSRTGQEKRLVVALASLVCGATSVRWFLEEIQLAKINVSTTTVHEVYLSADEKQIVDALNQIKGRRVVAAPPGIPAKLFAENSTEPLPDQFGTPIIGDLNPVLSGLTGAYTYAGHWSETPDYNRRRTEIQKLYLAKTSDEERLAILKKVGLTHLVAPKIEKENPLGLFDFTQYPGTKVVQENKHYTLLSLQPEKS